MAEVAYPQQNSILSPSTPIMSITSAAPMPGRTTVDEGSTLPVSSSSSTELHPIHIASYSSEGRFPKSGISGFSGNIYHNAPSSVSHSELMASSKSTFIRDSIPPSLPSFSNFNSKSSAREQLPNLAVVLSKIQCEQRLPLPIPTIPATSPVQSAYPTHYDAMHAQHYPASFVTSPYGSPGVSVIHTLSIPNQVSQPQYSLPPMYKLPIDNSGSFGLDNKYPSNSQSTSSTSVSSGMYADSLPTPLLASPEHISGYVSPKGMQISYSHGPSSSISASSSTQKLNVGARRRGKSVGSRRYQCKICSKFFTTSGHLARHTRIHTGVKNHVCPFEGCNARFSRQDNCMQHYKTHLNGKKSRRRPK